MSFCLLLPGILLSEGISWTLLHGRVSLALRTVTDPSAGIARTMACFLRPLPHKTAMGLLSVTDIACRSVLFIAPADGVLRSKAYRGRGVGCAVLLFCHSPFFGGLQLEAFCWPLNSMRVWIVDNGSGVFVFSLLLLFTFILFGAMSSGRSCQAGANTLQRRRTAPRCWACHVANAVAKAFYRLLPYREIDDVARIPTCV